MVVLLAASAAVGVEGKLSIFYSWIIVHCIACTHTFVPPVLIFNLFSLLNHRCGMYPDVERNTTATIIDGVAPTKMYE